MKQLVKKVKCSLWKFFNPLDSLKLELNKALKKELKRDVKELIKLELKKEKSKINRSKK